MLYKSEFVIASKGQPEWFLSEDDYWTSHLDIARIYNNYPDAEKYMFACAEELGEDLITLRVDTILSVHEEA